MTEIYIYIWQVIELLKVDGIHEACKIIYCFIHSELDSILKRRRKRQIMRVGDGNDLGHQCWNVKETTTSWQTMLCRDHGQWPDSSSTPIASSCQVIAWCGRPNHRPWTLLQKFLVHWGLPLLTSRQMAHCVWTLKSRTTSSTLARLVSRLSTREISFFA